MQVEVKLEEIKELESEIENFNIGDDEDNTIRTLMNLPDEILGTFVFKHLPLQILFKMAGVCKSFNQIFKNKKSLSVLMAYIANNDFFVKPSH